MTRLSILIVTKDRLPLFTRLVDKLVDEYSKSINKFNTIIVDNSDLDTYNQKVKLVSNTLPAVSIYHENSFIESRLKSVNVCTTEYFTIIDDDDLPVDGFSDLIHGELIATDYPDLLSFCIIKEGRDLPKKSYFWVEDKLDMLNSFNNYYFDRYTKFYVSNCCKIFNLELFRKGFQYKYSGMDDILPVLDYYLASESVVHVSTPLIIYNNNLTVEGTFDIDKVRDIEEQSRLSYSDLLIKYKNFPELILIIKKSIENTYEQYKLFYKYESDKLKSLL